MPNPYAEAQLTAAELIVTCQAGGLSPDVADWCVAALVRAVLDNPGRYDRVSVELLYRAARLRRLGRGDVAACLAHFAEAAVVRWADDVVIDALIADLAALPDGVEPPVAHH